jgi:hypothetical protein
MPFSLSPFRFRMALVLSMIAGPCAVPHAFAIEEPNFVVVEQAEEMELRDYRPYYIVSTPAGTEFESAGNRGFRTLFKYISGANAENEEIAMTAPVIQSRAVDGWSLAFVVPADYAPEAIPAPQGDGVQIEPVPGGLYAATRFSGGWSEARFMEHEAGLLAWIESAGLEVCGPARYARYDPPFKPPFLRRNEIIVPVARERCDEQPPAAPET